MADWIMQALLTFPYAADKLQVAKQTILIITRKQLHM